MQDNAASPVVAVLTPAPFWRRLLAMVYDLLCLIGIWFVVGGLAVGLHHGEAVEHSAWFAWLLLAAAAAYFAASWRRGGQTLGMKCWKIRVVDAASGGRLGWRQALVRFATAMVSWLPLGLGYWWALAGRRRAWHDLASGTRLVRA
jgi:uncharacterized RDD family membrane protein YckC